MQLKGQHVEQAEAAHRQQERDEFVLKAQRVQANSSRVVARLTAALVFTSLISGFVSYLQFGAAKDAANAAKESADASVSAAMTAVQQMRASEDANWLARANSASSQKQSKAALDDSIRNAETDQRAWVGVDRIFIEPPKLEANTSATITIAFKNTGKTPALDVASRHVEPVERDHTPTFFYSRQIRYGLLSPGGECHVSYVEPQGIIREGPRTFTRDLIERLDNASLRIYVDGCVFYQDIFKQRHWTTYCYFLADTKSGTFGACADHNDADMQGESPPPYCQLR